MIDARSWRINCCSIHSTFRTITCSLVEYVYVPIHDSLRYSRAKQHILHCCEVSPGVIHHPSTMYRFIFHSRYVHPLPNVPYLIGFAVGADFGCRFYFHEHARKIGIWAWAFVISPYLGPFLSAIIANFKPWRTSSWINFLIVGLALTFVTFLGDETLYDRDNTDIQPPKPQGWLKYKVQMLTGIYGAKCKGRTTVWQSTRDLFFLLTRPYFLFLCGTSPHLATL